MTTVQPRYGNGGRGHGRRLTDVELGESNVFGKADWMGIEEHKDRASRSRRKSRGNAQLAGGALAGAALVGSSDAGREQLGGMARMHRGLASQMPKTTSLGQRAKAHGVVHGAMVASPKLARGNAAIGLGALGAGLAARSYGQAVNGRRHERQVSRLRKERATIGKARFFDPEHRRQRRLGMAEAALAGGGIAGLVLGGRGAARTTKAIRAMATRGDKGTFNATVGGTKKGRRVLAAAPRELALLSGGAAATGGAVGVRQYAESRRGRGWN